jgi:hypothetical protein
MLSSGKQGGPQKFFKSLQKVVPLPDKINQPKVDVTKPVLTAK